MIEGANYLNIFMSRFEMFSIRAISFPNYLKDYPGQYEYVFENRFSENLGS